MLKIDEEGRIPMMLKLGMEVNGSLIVPGTAEASFVQPATIMVPVDEVAAKIFFVMATTKVDGNGLFRGMRFNVETGSPDRDTYLFDVSNFTPFVGILVFTQSISQRDEGDLGDAA